MPIISVHWCQFVVIFLLVQDKQIGLFRSNLRMILPKSEVQRAADFFDVMRRQRWGDPVIFAMLENKISLQLFLGRGAEKSLFIQVQTKQ